LFSLRRARIEDRDDLRLGESTFFHSVWDGPRNPFTLFSNCRAIREADTATPRNEQSLITLLKSLRHLLSAGHAIYTRI